ncbi:MAG: helix-turn-helix domain-containing protein [Symploca sp. SIO3E6]|nr:helix-turn-helix domain-containing protein [Caldora sp. SIO3E6]
MRYDTSFLEMAIAYSQDLRVRALDLVKGGMSISRVSRILQISRPTVYRWIEQFEKTGSTVPCKVLPPPQESKIQDWEKFKKVVDNNGDKTQKELAEVWGDISQQSISRGLKKLGYTRKKKLTATKSGVKNRELRF